MAYTQGTTTRLAADARSLGTLRALAQQQSPAALKQAAQQLESLFMQELIKSMRQATLKSGMLDNPGGDLGADLLDQQLAQQLSGQPGGLSEHIVRQLQQQTRWTPPSVDTTTAPTPPQVSAAPGAAVARIQGTASQAAFVQQHSQVAAQVERSSGIPAAYMIGQAGHETGWGKHEIRQADGASSHNLFGIKAGASWKGKVAEVTTTEYVNGQAQKRIARFRAYDSYADAFKDYARLISESPRYAQARSQTASATDYAQGLQQAGYATDPQYAAKLSRAINTTLALRRAWA